MRKTLLLAATAALLSGGAVAWAQGMPSQGGNNPRPENQTHQQPAAKPNEGNTGPGAVRPGSDRQMQRTQVQGGANRDQLQGGQMLRGGDIRAEGARHPLTIQERTNLRETVLRTGPRVTHVNFRIGVGVAVPRNIRLVAVPQPILAIYPDWSGDLYFDYGDEVVVVAPNTMQIVGVLPL
ncbi:MAG TPA: DUF1236 domain-containing protein [Rhizomicrobium sp.]|jgi:hypothetical protein|nr:DUF1236 domain-containing protein [Rhizomicrobium sp.]